MSNRAKKSLHEHSLQEAGNFEQLKVASPTGWGLESIFARLTEWVFVSFRLKASSSMVVKQQP